MATATEQPWIAHYCKSYLPLTEGFIYSVLTGVQRVRPHVVCQALTEYADLFPLPEGSISVLNPRRNTPAWLADAVRSRTTSEVEMDEFRASRILDVPQAKKFRLIHAHFGHVGAEVLDSSQRLGIPLVTNFYGSDTAPFTDDPSWPERRKRLFAEGALFLVEGAFMRQRLVELGAPPEKVRLQRISFRFDQLPAKMQAESGRPPVMLFAGRFVEKKGLQFGLEAAAEIHKRGLPFEFRIIGGGPLEQEHRDLVARAGMESKIRFLGLLPRAKYLEELARADIFVSPSVTAANGDTEGGAPTTILEAQALGIPVLATTHADIPNVVVPGQSALLAPERDTVTLAEHMRVLLEDRSLWARMGRVGQEYVAAHHDVSREARLLEESYFSVL